MHDLEAVGREQLAVLLLDLVVVLEVLQQRRAAGQHHRGQQPHADRSVEEVEELLAEAGGRAGQPLLLSEVFGLDAPSGFVAQPLLGFAQVALVLGKDGVTLLLLGKAWLAAVCSE